MMLHRQVGLLVVLVVLFISLPLAVSWRQRWRLRASRTHTAAATLTLATSLLCLNVSPAIAAPAADGKAALQMVTSSRDQLKKIQSLDDPAEIKTTTYNILNNDLKANVKLALDSVLSIKNDGKQYYNTVKYHGTTAIDDIQLIQDWFTNERPSRKAPEDRRADQLAFGKQASAAAAEELDKFIDGVSGEKIKDVRGGPGTLDIIREIEINMQ